MSQPTYASLSVKITQQDGTNETIASTVVSVPVVVSLPTVEPITVNLGTI